MSRTVYYTNYIGETDSCKETDYGWWSEEDGDIPYLPNGPHHTAEVCEANKRCDLLDLILKTKERIASEQEIRRKLQKMFDDLVEKEYDFYG